MYRRKKFATPIKITACTLALLLFSETIAPTLVLAVSSGPSQADFNGFTSGDSSEMVDLATGNFKYDIPLITVPGPDGGYPMVLSYNAGIGMHDEAGWVGLGWSLNPGVVNRQMRGIPDDFSGDNGDKVTKTDFIRDNMNIGLNVSSDLMAIIPEVYGFDLGMAMPNVNFPVSYGMYYNTFKGLGARAGLGAVLSNEMTNARSTISFNLNMDSNEGGEVQGNLSANALVAEATAGFKYNARGGITSVSKGLSFNMPGIPNPLYKAGGNFSTASHVPEVDIPMKGGSAALSIDMEVGGAGTHSDIPLRIEGTFAFMAVSKPIREFKPYGYMYTHRRALAGRDNAIMDYNRDNDAPINMKLPSLAVPVLTNDIYTLKGVGGGGVFRAFRNDAGIYYQPDAFNRNGGASIGFEAAAATGFKVAADVSGYYSSSYSGTWRGDFGNLYNKFPTLGNEAPSSTPNTREAFYFRMLGEKTPFRNQAVYDQYDKNRPSHIGITYTNAAQEELDPKDMPDYKGDYPFSGMQKFKTGIANRMNGKPIPLFSRYNREKRTTLVEYRTADEVRQGGAAFPIYNSKNVANAPITENNLKTYQSTLQNLTYTEPHIQKNHIVEFSVLQTDGSRYYYGIPAYNKRQLDATFSCTASGSGAGNDPTSGPLIAYATQMTAFNGNTSRDKYISANEISPYAHSYLLTNIVSADYIDVSGDGPSSDDYGSYTKFNYHRRNTDFKWRVPFTALSNFAVAAKGALSVEYDNKATYSYGTKEIWYLHSVETKTHVAFFITSARRDGNQALGENGGVDPNTTDRLQKLDKIILFSKKELSKPSGLPIALQTVDFQYSYDLCPNVPSNDGATVGTHPDGTGDANAKRGKLTLEKVIITHQGSSKGRLTPYSFDYGSSAEDNPAYAYGNTDRWGSYRPDNETVTGFASRRNDYNPYTVQSPAHKTTLDQQAGAWNLKSIRTPSGSNINIQYECDDYAYVQDKQAQQMMEIIGTGKTDGSEDVFFAGGTNKVPIRQNFRRLYFKPESPIDGTDAEIKAAISRYVENLPDKRVYFKANERLQIPKESSVSTNFVTDYVTGYTSVENYGYIRRGGEVVPYIVIPEVKQKGKNPLRVAGLQYLRYKRADLSKTAPGGMQNVAEAVLGTLPMFFSSLEMIFGFYTWSLMKGHCEFLSNDKPSYIRLNSPDGIKYGGGHRVKKITVTDGWNSLSGGSETAQSYEQNFVYRSDRRGTAISSGVAAYEPVFGGDENALKYPHFYDPDNRFIHNDPAFFIEDPLPETYYPAPQVAYSRVTVYTSATESEKISGAGIAVNEFYTAQDYPTVSRASEPTKTDDDQTAFIPFIASIQFRNTGYSQGFSVEVNDMHGKPKARYTYDSDNWDNLRKQPQDANRYLTYKKYIYNQTTPQALLGGNSNGWPEDYPTLAADVPDTSPGALGLDFELFSELRESSGFSFGGGAQINGGVDPLPYVIFITAMPYFDYTETGSRTVTTNKVIYHTGVLTEVISYNEGNIERTRHVAFDAETGEPVLTVTTSDYDDQKTDSYDKPTYSYDMPAHWYNKGMGGAYTNYRVDASLYTASGKVDCVNASVYFNPGDELYCATCATGDKLLWINEVGSDYFKIVNRQGAAPGHTGTYTYVVNRSGKRNLQDAVAGNIVSVSPPNAAGPHPYFTAFNQAAANPATNWNQLFSLSYPDCINPQISYSFSISYRIMDDYAMIQSKYENCRGAGVEFTFDRSVHPSNIRVAPGPQPNTVLITYLPSGNTEVRNASLNFEDCAPVCAKGVLDASTVEYRDSHEYDAADLPAQNLNDYASGKKGIYRLARSNAYFTNRKQASGPGPIPYETFTGEDGVYDLFSKFDFATGNAWNQQKNLGWRWASQVPERAYARDGKVLQTVNPLGILTGNLYGYDRNLVTATAVNASHREIGFDGFEEYAAGTYLPAGSTGRLPFQIDTNQTFTVVTQPVHSGRNSLQMKAKTSASFTGFTLSLPVVPAIDENRTDKTLQLQAGKKYVLSFWVQHKNYPITSPTGVYLNTVPVDGIVVSPHPVDGWYRVEQAFTAPSTPGTAQLSVLHVFIRETYLDDIRIHPFNAEMKTMVYDPLKYVPTAELDGRNYATFYVYDEEGKAVLTKKETERGIFTVGHTRNNINR